MLSTGKSEELKYRIAMKKLNQDYNSEYDYTIETTRGMIHKKYTFFYTHFFLARRLLSSIWIVASNGIEPRLRIGGFIFLQVVWLGYK